MPLYVADYLADTGHLSTVEHGAYMLLIMHYWQNDGLPDDDKRLARVVRLPFDEWIEIRDVLSEFFGEGWRHQRIDAELEKTRAIISKRRTAGKAGASQRYGKPVASAMANAQQSHSHPPSPSPIPEPNGSGADAPPVVYADDRAELFGEGKQALACMGVPAKQTGSLIGGWLKQTGDDCRRVLQAIQQARDQRAIEPVSFISAQLGPPKGRKNDQSTGSYQRSSGQSAFLAGLASLANDPAGDGAMAGAGNAEIPRGRFNIDG